MLLATLPWGQVPVASVRVEAPGARDPARLLRVFGVRPGDVLTRQVIRQGVQALVASGEVEDVTVEVVPEGDVLALVVHAQVVSRVKKLEFSGLSARHREMIKRELALTVGGPLSVPHLERNLERAVRVLQADGYPDAELVPELAVDVTHGTVHVRVVGRLGAPLRVCALEAQGVPWEQGRLWRALEVKPGQRLTQGTQEGMRRRLLANLRQAGYWQAEVEGPFLEAQPCGAKARFEVRAGDHFTLALSQDRVAQEVLREALPFLSGEDGFADGSEEWLAARLRRALQRRGYLMAEVNVRQETTPSERRLHIGVKKGDKVTITAVRFPGIGDDGLAATLREYVAAGPGRLRKLAGQTVDDDTLAGDREALRQALQTLGYPQVQVGGPKLHREGRGAVLEFPVELGPRFLVSNFELRGWPQAVPLPNVPLAGGQPWSLAAEEEAQSLVWDYLQNAGYPDATVQRSRQCEDGHCHVVFEVDPGPRVNISRVVVAVSGRTDPTVVEKILGLAPGQPLSADATLQAQRRLLGLGIFERVTVREIPGQDYGMQRGIVVEPVEAPSRSMSAGIGWDTQEKLRLSASWSELNLFGKARTLSLEGRFSARHKGFQVNYREPAPLGVFGQPTWVAIYRSEETFSSYSLLRRGMWVELGDHLARPRRFLVRYDYQIIAPEAPVEVLSSLERAKQQLRLASLTPVFEWDTRNDTFSPSRGNLLSVQLQRAFPVFLADASFTKVTASFTWLHPAGKAVVAVGVRGGVVRPHQGSASTPDNLRVPIAVRFFSGGRISHRAFATDRLGVPGQTLLCPTAKPHCGTGELEPVGGAAQLLGNLEWRVPVSGSFGATVFVDAGNTWAGLSQVALRDVRWGAGLGLRFETPVGPLRLEYGWKLDRMPGESKGELFLSFGNPF